MWILKKIKRVTRTSQFTAHINRIKTYEFFTLYTTIPHTKLKSSFKALINQVFFYKIGNRRYKYRYLVFDRESSFFVVQHTDFK